MALIRAELPTPPTRKKRSSWTDDPNDPLAYLVREKPPGSAQGIASGLTLAPATAPSALAILTMHPASARKRHRVARCRWCGGDFYLAYGKHWLCESPVHADRQLAHAILAAAYVPGESPFLFVPLPLNVDLAESPYKRTLQAGSAGSSKSFGARWLIYSACIRRPGLRVLLLRTTLHELMLNHWNFVHAEITALGCAVMKDGYHKSIVFSNGSLVWLGYCDNEHQIPRHLGVEADLIVFDEAVTFLERALSEISARDRGSQTVKHLGLRDGKTWLLSNPGGRAMNFLHDHYISKQVDRLEYPKYNPDQHGYIAAKLEDNPYLGENYEIDTLGALPAARYEQLRNGRWDVFVGQFFHIDPEIHVQAIEVPHDDAEARA